MSSPFVSCRVILIGQSNFEQYYFFLTSHFAAVTIDTASDDLGQMQYRAQHHRIDAVTKKIKMSKIN